ncbi:hypothetical protein CR513_12822, partial [Mucuna pruriens]
IWTAIRIFCIWIIGVAIICVEKRVIFNFKNETVKSIIEFENNTNTPILEKYQVIIRLKDGSQNFIFDVSYAPCLLKFGTTIRKMLQHSYSSWQLHVD